MCDAVGLHASKCPLNLNGVDCIIDIWKCQEILIKYSSDDI